MITPLQMIGGAILLLAQGFALLSFLQRRKIESMVALVVGVLIFSTTVFSVTLPSLKRMWVAREVVREARLINTCPTLAIVSAGYQEPSLAFLAGSNTKVVPNGSYAAAEMQHDLCRVGVINKPLLAEFLGASYDAATQPIPVGPIVEGINGGQGSKTELYFYVMPQERPPTPVYP
jgi:hypothetical protein